MHQRFKAFVSAVACFMLIATPAFAQRGRAGGGMPRGGYGGGMPRGGFGGGLPSGASSSRSSGMTPYGGYHSGSYTGSHGGSVNYGAAGNANRGAYGAQVTTPGGRTYSTGGQYGAGSRNGYGGYGAGGYGAGGYGAYGAGARPYGTYYASEAGLASAGAWTRAACFGAYPYTGAWFASYPGAWNMAGYSPAMAAAPGAWGGISSYCNYPQQPAYYDYGGNVVSQPDSMYVNGDPQGPPEEYARQASAIAGAGADAPSAQNADWRPLGVFAIVPKEEGPPKDLFQLAINPQGVLRGNYFNARTNKVAPISGSVDAKTLRAAWTVGKAEKPVYEAGIANLTKDQTTMLIHEENGKSKQVALARMPAPDSGGDDAGAPPPPAPKD